MLGKAVYSLLTGALLAATPGAQAFELYSWTVAEGFCELRSYGLERRQAIAIALEQVLARNPFMRLDFTLDSAVVIQGEETLAIRRIRGQAERRCPRLARRSKNDGVTTRKVDPRTGPAPAPEGQPEQPQAQPSP